MEFVFVIPREKLFPASAPHGFVRFEDAGADLAPDGLEEVARVHGFFVEREHAERDPSLKQVIPYTVVHRGGTVLLLRRLPKGGESRLHGKLSIGVGGHVNPEDAAGRRESPLAILEAATRRELSEEIHVRGRTRLARRGWLNDDSNPVGAVHVGLVQVLDVEGEVTVREEDVLEGRMVPPSELAALLAGGAELESWSRFLVQRLDEILPRNVLAVTRTSS